MGTLCKPCSPSFSRLVQLSLVWAVFVLLSASGMVAQAAGQTWKNIAAGLDYAVFLSGENATQAGEVHALRIVPEQVSFRLLTSSGQERESRPLKDWVQSFDLAAAINASMFWKDQRTSTGFLKNFEHFNNESIHPEFGAFFAFNPKSADQPPVRLIDRRNEPEWRSLIAKYHSVVQNYRMISARGESVWQPSDESYSVAAIAMDTQDRVLFLFSQSPRSIYGLNQTLLSLPLDIRMCMFVEGGPTAGMYIRTEGFEKGWRGVSDKGLWVEKPGRLFKIPNIIGVEQRR